MLKLNTIHHGDCLELMSKLPDRSIDLILTDPPYGTTNCKWDSVIPFIPMWRELKRVRKPNTAIVLFGTEPFTSLLITSNIKEFKYNWIWQKDKPTNHLNSKKQPLRLCEYISVFYKLQCVYNPQLSLKDPKNIRAATLYRPSIDNYGSMDKKSKRAIPDTHTYPRELIQFGACFSKKGQSYHPTQKPVDLLEFLIKTYSNEGNTVLDFTIGSGSTALASKNTQRNFIGIEKDLKYIQVAERRLESLLVSS